MPRATIQTHTGPVTLSEMDGAIIRVEWGLERDGEYGDDTPVLRRAKAQLAEYFDGIRRVFDLPLHVEGSDFQRAVCDAILAIPWGQTCTYGDIAKALSVPAQTIGQACGGNPIPIIIPCHRVLGACGLGGFSGAGGVETKVALLRLEGGLLI